jgi:hypothetical protein
MNERGQLLPENLPLDSTLARALSRDKRECREAVRLLVPISSDLGRKWQDFQRAATAESSGIT